MTRIRAEQVDESFVPIPATALYVVEIDGESVLLDEARDRLHVLNATGTIVWMCFDGQASIADIVTDIADVIGVPRDIVLSDALELTRHLGTEGLLDNVVADPSIDAPATRDEPADDPLDCEDDDEAPPEQAISDDPRFVPEPPNP